MEFWATLLQQAVDQSACAEQACHVKFMVRSAWADIRHVDDQVHDCAACPPRQTPERIVSLETVQTKKREEVVTSLALWLDHFHAPTCAAEPSDPSLSALPTAA